MAGVKGPLFSLDASGTVGDAIVYSKWKGRNYVRRHAIPANPKSVSQVSVRAMMRYLAQQWAGLSDGQQTDWETRAAATNISEFNAFTAYNMDRWGRFLCPSKLDPATHGGTPAITDTPTCVAGVRSIAVGFDVSTANDGWGALLFRGLTDYPTPARNTLLRVVPAEGAATYAFLDTDVTVGVEYWYVLQGFTDEGDFGVALNIGAATPTA